MKSLYEFMASLDEAYDNQELDYTMQRFRLRLQEETRMLEKRVFLLCELFGKLPGQAGGAFVTLLLNVLDNGCWHVSCEKQRRLKKLSKQLSKAMKKESSYEVRSIVAKISEFCSGV